MPIDPVRLKNWPVQEVVHAYSARDTILYALSVGLGADPTDPHQLRYVNGEALQVLPTMSLVLGDSALWFHDPEFGLDWPRVLYGEVSIELHAALPSQGVVIGRTTIDDVIDRGINKGALIYTSRTVTDQSSGQRLCTVRSTYVCRSEGGFGGPAATARPLHALPARHPDASSELPTLPQAALLYRLNGDSNPLHADPVVAQGAGFERPILHGLCTVSVAGHALLKILCNYDSARVRSLRARFSKPVYPGETLCTDIWREAHGLAGFRCRVIERGIVVLDNGLLEYEEA